MARFRQRAPVHLWVFWESAAITQGTLKAIGNYTIGTYDPGTLTITKANAIVVVKPYSVVYNGVAHEATGVAYSVK